MKPPICLPTFNSLSLFLVICWCFIDIAVLAFNPYHVLGVSRSASITEIKHAYKNLARKYHPDKNKDKEAEDRFIELNRAYELLSDPDKRRHFDKTGQPEDSPNFMSKHDYSSFNRFDFDSFDTFFTGQNGQKFKFTFNTNNYFRKHSITHRAYENTILPQSFTRPFLIVFYGDLCIPCVQFEQVFQKTMGDLEALGINFATVHSQHENVLARKLGVRSLPHIISLVDGDVRPFRGDDVSYNILVDFIARALPKDLIVEVNDQNYVTFLTGWRDNKVRVLFVSEDSKVKLNYRLVAFYFRERIAFGYVKADHTSRQLRERYHVTDAKMSSMLIFNEDISRSVATLSVSDLKTQLMKDVLDSNKYLFLPRITSQIMFDYLCPTGSAPSRMKLCVMLVASDNLENEPKFEEMRNFIRENNYSKDRFRFMYIYRERQAEFVRALSEGFRKGNIYRGVHVVVFWRREVDHVYYEWLDNEWDLIDSTYINETRNKLAGLLTRLSQNAAQFSNDAKLPSVIDESAKSLISRIVRRLLLVTENLSDNIAHTDPVPIVSIILTLAIIIFIGYTMTYFMRLEEESIKEKRKLSGECRTTTNGASTTRVKKEPPFNIHELRGETYNGLIRLSKPGCRTIVLLCDNSSKERLLARFRKFVLPYRKNKTLLFAFLMVEKNLDWYRKVLMQTLGDDRDLNINPKNCIGTVISINGFRKYFCVYHAKHPEIKNKRSGADNNGQFLGLDDSDLSSEQESDVESGMLVATKPRVRRNGAYLNALHEEIIFEENLLDGLPTWLERLFEGSTIRYHINFWPEHMK